MEKKPWDDVRNAYDAFVSDVVKGTAQLIKDLAAENPGFVDTFIKEEDTFAWKDFKDVKDALDRFQRNYYKVRKPLEIAHKKEVQRREQELAKEEEERERREKEEEEERQRREQEEEERKAGEEKYSALLKLAANDKRLLEEWKKLQKEIKAENDIKNKVAKPMKPFW